MKPEEKQVEAKSFITYRNYKRRLTIKQIQKELLSIRMLLHINGQNMRKKQSVYMIQDCFIMGL